MEKNNIKNKKKGCKKTEEWKIKIGQGVSKTRKRLFKDGKPNEKNENNKNWKGDNIKYEGLHLWISRHKKKPLFCEDCRKDIPYDLANISGKYKRDINDFKWICRKCHMKEDGRLNNRDNFGRFKNNG